MDARLPFLTDQAIATTATLRGPVDTIGLAGRAVALMVVAAAGVFWVDRRRVEVGLLSARGVGPWQISLKVVLEVLIPATAAAAAGAFAARGLVRWLGPLDVLDPPSVALSTRQVIWTTVVAVIVLGLVAGVGSRRILELGSPRRRDLLRSTPWEPVLLVLAAASLYEILTRGTAPIQRVGAVPQVDQLLLLFPILFVAGGAGLAARGLRRLLPRLRSAGGRWPEPLYLASRRLTSSSRTALVLVVVSSSAVGILAYAAVLSSSTEATARAKALVFTGADVSVTLRSAPAAPPRLPFPATVVKRVERAVSSEGGGQIDLLAVDPMTFEGAAFWDESFSDDSLSALMGRLSSDFEGGRLPVLVVGSDLPAETTVRVPGQAGIELDVRVAARTNAFPGMRIGTPLMVLDRSALSAVTVGLDQLWARGDPADVLAGVDGAGLPVVRSVSGADVAGTPQFLSTSWTFGFLQALGVMTGLIALGGALLHLEARQRAREVSYALARRMGLRRRAHLMSVAVELACILFVSLLIGTGLALIAARIVLGELDPLPAIPPPPLFRLPLLLLAATGGVAAAASWVGALRVQRAADRTNVAEVMRLAPWDLSRICTEPERPYVK